MIRRPQRAGGESRLLKVKTLFEVRVLAPTTEYYSTPEKLSNFSMRTWDNNVRPFFFLSFFNFWFADVFGFCFDLPTGK